MIILHRDAQRKLCQNTARLERDKTHTVLVDFSLDVETLLLSKHLLLWSFNFSYGSCLPTNNLQLRLRETSECHLGAIQWYHCSKAHNTFHCRRLYQVPCPVAIRGQRRYEAEISPGLGEWKAWQRILD
jgi:hypothetical protein